jgi:hypothetical protein
MPRPSRWTCPSCHRQLGAVDRQGTLIIDGQQVQVQTEDGQLIVVVICLTCRQGRPWIPRGLETKAATGVG